MLKPLILATRVKLSDQNIKENSFFHLYLVFTLQPWALMAFLKQLIPSKIIFKQKTTKRLLQTETKMKG